MLDGSDWNAVVIAFGNLPLDPLHQDDQFLGLVVPFGLLAHLLEVLRGVGNAIRHWGMIL